MLYTAEIHSMPDTYSYVLLLYSRTRAHSAHSRVLTRSRTGATCLRSGGICFRSSLPLFLMNDDEMGQQTTQSFAIIHTLSPTFSLEHLRFYSLTTFQVHVSFSDQPVNRHWSLPCSNRHCIHHTVRRHVAS